MNRIHHNKEILVTDQNPTSTSGEEVTCRVCHATYVPDFINDFYADGADPKVGRCERCMMSEAFGVNTKSPHALPKDYENSVCKIGKGAATCAFLTMGAGGFQCGKDSTVEKAIRERLAEGTMRSKGDNCSGAPNFTPST